MRIGLIGGVLICLFNLSLLSQNAHNQALVLARRASKVMQKGESAAAMDLLQRALALDPTNIHIQYQMALLHYFAARYLEASEILKETTRDPAAPVEHFAFLGNAYDNLGDEENALRSYRRGLRKYPQSGRLYAEMGILSLNHNRLDEAMLNWEQGIDLDPQYAANYYWAAKAYAHTSEKLWALLYGELYLLLAPAGERSKEISMMLLRSYENSVEVLGDELVVFRFSMKAYARSSEERWSLMRGDDSRGFEQAFVERFQASGAQFSLGLGDTYTIAAARAAFLTHWQADASLTEQFANPLFPYWEQIRQAGLWEAYHFWLLQAGDTERFNQWVTQGQNDGQLSGWLQWQKSHPLTIPNEQRMNRLRYAQ